MIFKLDMSIGRRRRPGGGSGPVNSVLPSISGTAQVGSTLTGSRGTWSGTPIFSDQWQWSSDGVTGWTNLTGATSLTYVPPIGDQARFLRLRVEGTDVGGTTVAFSAPTLAVAAQPAGPTNTVAPAHLGTFVVGQTVSVSNGTWSATPSEFQYRWTYGALPVPGATASSYLIEDFTFGASLFAEVRARTAGSAWSEWVAATGGQTVAAPAQNVKWVAEFLGFSPNNPRSFTTPAVSAGDCIVMMVEARRNGFSRGFVQGDFTLGTLRHASSNSNNEVLGLVTYVCPTAEASLTFSVGHPDVVEFETVLINIGPHIFHSAAGTDYAGSGAFNFPALTAPANAKVFWGLGVKDAPPSYTASPTPPSKATATPYAAGGNFDSGDSTSFMWFIRTQTSAGSVATQTLTPSGYHTNKHVVAAFTPQVVAPSVPAGKYIADSNGAGLARSSTVSSVVTDGVTITFNAPVKVGNYISNNIGLGSLWALDAGSGVRINSHTGSVIAVNHPAIIDGTTGQAFVSASGATGPTYNASLAASLPYTAVAGDVILISVNHGSPVNSSYVEKYVTLTIVDTVPFDDEFAPPYCWHASLGARPRFRFSDWNQGARPLPSLAAQANAPSLSVSAQPFNRRCIDLVNTWNNYSISATAAQPLYGTDLVKSEKDALAILCADYTVAQKTPHLIGYLQRGIDTWGVYRAGKAQDAGSIWYSADGGQKMGRKTAIVFAGYMLGNNAMRDVDATAALSDFQEDGSTGYITQAVIDHTQAGGWNGGAKVPAGSPSAPYVQGMLNGQSLNYPMPEWVGRIYDPNFTLANWNAHWGGHSYRFSGNHEDWTSEVLLAAAVGLKPFYGNNAWFDYSRRHQNIQRYGVDPWRLAGGAVNRYPMVAGAPSVGDRAPSSGSSGWAQRMYWAHIDTVSPYPWA